MSLEAELEQTAARHGQIVTPLGDGSLAVSCGKTLEGDVRAALLRIPGVVRIDVRCVEDTIHLLARSLGEHGLRVGNVEDDQAAVTVVGPGLLASETLSASHQTIEVLLGTVPRTQLRVDVGLLTDREQGTVMVTAQGRLRSLD